MRAFSNIHTLCMAGAGQVEGEHDVAQKYQLLWLEACKLFYDLTRPGAEHDPIGGTAE